MFEALKTTDTEVFAAIKNELHRQFYELEMIASENITSMAVLEAQGSVLTNKYAEGYPKKRHYRGCANVDVCEQLAIDRVKKIFGAEHANVQPHSGTQANMAAYFALIEPGAKILTMDLSHGGHLSHGMVKNFSGMFYDVVHYGVSKETEMIDMDEVRTLAEEHKPDLILVGASAYGRTLDFATFGDIAKSVGAKLFADIAHIAGLVAAGLHPNPVPHCDVVTFTTHKTMRGPRGGVILCKEEYAKVVNSRVFPGTQGGPLEHVIAAKAVAFNEAMSPEFKAYQQKVINNAKALCRGLASRGVRIASGDTDNHLMLVDLRQKDITGRKAANRLGKVGITVNRNQIPFDPLPQSKTSGIRVGSPALTTRGMGEEEMDKVCKLISRIVDAPDDEATAESVKGEVRELCEAFPIYPELMKAFELK